jgi:hypothetical protein
MGKTQQLLARSFSRYASSVLLRQGNAPLEDGMATVASQRPKLSAYLVYSAAIAMSFIGFGLSTFSLSRLQSSSDRRTLELVKRSV